MFLRTTGQFRSSAASFNMTALIDIVFLLIIFFMVVCQFIEAENFPVVVPDDCEFAQSDAEHRAQVTTVTVMKTAKEEIDFAVGSKKITALSYADGSGPILRGIAKGEPSRTQKKGAFGGADIVEKLAELIDVSLRDLPPDRRVVTLRVDKDVCFSEAQYALAGIAASSAANIQLAVLRDRRISPE